MRMSASFHLCPGPQWSAKLLGRYEFGVNQVFESVLDGAVSITHDSYLIGRKANVQVEPNYDQVTYRELRFDILYDAPFLNIINETEFNGSTDHRSFSAGCSPRLLGLSSAGPSVIVYVVCIEAGHCESYHELKVALFSTSYCEPGKGTWCENPIGPLTLTTDVPCSEKLPRMAFAPLDTDVMILLDSYPESEFLSCIFVQNGQSPCRLGGGLPKNRLDIQYFYNVSTQETLMQVKAEGSSDSYSQYMIDRFGSIRKLYSSDNTEQNPPCPMLSPSVFNCTSGLKFMNGSLVHLTDAIGEPQGFQSSFGTKGVAYMKLTGKETAVVVLRPSLDGGSQVLDNSSWICSNNIRVKPIYVLNNGAVIVITRCFPDGDSIFQVYLYNVTVAHYALVPSHHAMHLGSGQFGRILNVHVIGQLFLVEGANVPLVPTVLPPGSPTAVTVTPSMNESTIIIIAIVILGLAATVVAAVVIVTYVCHQRKGRKWRSCFTQCHGIDNGDRQSLLGRGDNDVEDGHNRDDDKRSLEGDLGGQEVVRPGSPGKDDEQAQEQDNKQTDENIDASRQQGAEAAIGDELQIGDTMELTHGTAAMGQGNMTAANDDLLKCTYSPTPPIPMHQTQDAGAPDPWSVSFPAPKPPPVVSEIQRTVPPDEGMAFGLYCGSVHNTLFSVLLSLAHGSPCAYHYCMFVVTLKF